MKLSKQPDGPFFIIVLAKEDVVPQGGVEDPGLLGHVREGAAHCDAALQQRHLQWHTSCEIMPPHAHNTLHSTEFK